LVISFIDLLTWRKYRADPFDVMKPGLAVHMYCTVVRRVLVKPASASIVGTVATEQA
jgi:hypothetical protein